MLLATTGSHIAAFVTF